MPMLGVKLSPAKFVPRIMIDDEAATGAELKLGGRMCVTTGASCVNKEDRVPTRRLVATSSHICCRLTEDGSGRHMTELPDVHDVLPQPDTPRNAVGV